MASTSWVADKGRHQSVCGDGEGLSSPPVGFVSRSGLFFFVHWFGTIFRRGLIRVCCASECLLQHV